MVWDGYFALGGLEIGNSPRALAYARSADCPPNWFNAHDECPTLWETLEHIEYNHDTIPTAPWFDTDDPDLSSRFYGLYIVGISGLHDSTREASVTQRLVKGGRVGAVREGSREIRVRAVLSAQGRDALEHGRIWLTNTLATNACGTHGSACGGADFEFFADIPSTEPVLVDKIRRFVHSVKCVSGPLVQQELISQDDRHHGLLVEFTLIAEMPDIYSLTHEIDIPPILPTVVQDTSFNLVPVPSAYLASGSVVVARNLSTNPSVEVNGADWVGWAGAISVADPAPYLTNGRTTELAAGDGVASFRNRILGDGATSVPGATADVGITNVVPLGSLPAGTRASASIWGAAIIFGGGSGSDVITLKGVVEWRNGADATISAVELGSVSSDADLNGHVFSAKSLLVPAGAVNAHVYVVARVMWSSSTSPASNSDIRVYADTVALTVP